MFPPGSRFKHYWDYLMVLLVLYNIILTPMQFGFSQGPMFVESWAILFALDVAIWLLFVGTHHLTTRASVSPCSAAALASLLYAPPRAALRP